MMAAAAEDAAADEPTSSTSTHKIIIIGAGIAGISAAHHLVKNGETDFKILEARNRIGGRIISIPLGENLKIILYLVIYSHNHYDYRKTLLFETSFDLEYISINLFL